MYLSGKHSFLSIIFYGLFRNIIDKTNIFVNKKINLIYLLGLLAILVQRLVFAGFLTDTYLWTTFAVGIYIAKTFRENSQMVIVPRFSGAIWDERCHCCEEGV